MRQLKFAKEISTERINEFEKLISIARTKQPSNAEQRALLEKVRSGESELIEKLVDSWEVNILSIAKQIPTEIPIEELIAIGKKELNNLAEHEINSEIRERFFRFGAWCVRQGMLKLII
ncbi:MAG: hypothetical protein ABIR03_11260, partial [Ginsengibacter sp.]